VLQKATTKNQVLKRGATSISVYSGGGIYIKDPEGGWTWELYAVVHRIIFTERIGLEFW
jgi:hypothetical protein